MTATTWTIHTKNNGTFTVNYITNQPPRIQRGGTININMDVSNFSLLQDYIEYAGSYKTLEELNGGVLYDETVPSGADVSSIVFGIEPNTNLDGDNVYGIWGILDSATDNRPMSLTTEQMGVTFLVLAKYSDYTDHADIESGLKMNV